jgi:hypothetical protein
MIKIITSSLGSTLLWKTSDGAGGFKPGKLIESKMRKLKEEEWNKFNTLLNKLEFWQMESIDQSDRFPDGSSWVLEGLKNTKYHIVERQNGGEYDYYKNCCKYLIELTDFEIEKIY